MTSCWNWFSMNLFINNLELFIEKGRHSGIARYNRLCKCCSRNDIEDEYHFILVCPCYLDLRQKLIKKFYFYKASVFKFVK